MKIEYLQDMEVVENQRLAKKLRYLKYSSYQFETGWWGEEALLVQNDSEEKMNDRYRCNFVGIVWYQDRLYLSLPKSVKFNQEESQEKKKERLIEYAGLMELFADEVRSKSDKFTPFTPWCVENLTQWCMDTMNTIVSLPTPQVIAAVKFEKVFEWMLGILFSNQVKIQKNQVLFESRYITANSEDASLNGAIDINSQDYNFYHWTSVKKRSQTDRKLKARENVFEDQEKRNIPDIISEIRLAGQESRKCCCIFDAKYSGWNPEKQRYKLPDNTDIYKQFFYQEQLLRMYEENQIKDMEVYNFLIMPDYLGDTDEHILRLCATIEFFYHDSRKIPVLQVDMEKLIRFCIYKNQQNEQEYVGKILQDKEDYLNLMLTGNKKVIPMQQKKV